LLQIGDERRRTEDGRHEPIAIRLDGGAKRNRENQHPGDDHDALTDSHVKSP
jgi:hypothetical protein